jgi:hypothetical protein
MFRKNVLGSVMAAVVLAIVFSGSMSHKALATDKNIQGQVYDMLTLQGASAKPVVIAASTGKFPTGTVAAGKGVKILPGVARDTGGSNLVVEWVIGGGVGGASAPNVRLDFLYCLTAAGTPVAWATDGSATQSITVTSLSGGQTIATPKGGFNRMAIQAVNLDGTYGATLTAINVGSF